jgi:lysylphosphatidylglycerol synthetase-like protein (DUF2156 family)
VRWSCSATTARIAGVTALLQTTSVVIETSLSEEGAIHGLRRRAQQRPASSTGRRMSRILFIAALLTAALVLASPALAYPHVEVQNDGKWHTSATLRFLPRDTNCVFLEMRRADMKKVAQCAFV